MLAFVLLSIERDIFDIITAMGVFMAGVGLILNARANYISVINKCTAEFRTIVRRMQSNTIHDDYNQLMIINDLCGLFNEQLYYMGKFYLPLSFRKEWKKTIRYYLFNCTKAGIEIPETIIINYERLYKFYIRESKKQC